MKEGGFDEETRMTLDKIPAKGVTIPISVKHIDGDAFAGYNQLEL